MILKILYQIDNFIFCLKFKVNENILQALAIVAVIGLLTLSPVFASQTDCPEHFADGQAPELINQKLSVKTREVCYSGYAIEHSGVTRTPLYSAEHLTQERMIKAKKVNRQGQFHSDKNIPKSERAELRHYARSGFDRGHVAPSGDMFDTQSQHESFSLANMVPQVPENNRGQWEGIESAVRKMAETEGELYVVTGPIFLGENLQRIGGAVMVPTRLFKAVYNPKKQEAGAYLIDNTSDAQPQEVSIAELEKLTGINFFPSVIDTVKARKMDLPDSRHTTNGK